MIVKHVGKHGDRKVAIVFREVPGEEHMALVVYPETLPVAMHDALIRTIESPAGQTADSLGDVLFRTLFPDGRGMLQAFHSEGMLKKVQTKQVVVTPNPSSHVNLEEMNRILSDMKMGNDAIRKMADLDSNRGMTGKVGRKDDYGREIGAPSDLRGTNVAGSDAARALDDAALAENFRDQAKRMAAEARQLLAESDRLMKEAGIMSGSDTSSMSTQTTAKRGRPSKAKAVARAVG